MTVFCNNTVSFVIPALSGNPAFRTEKAKRKRTTGSSPMLPDWLYVRLTLIVTLGLDPRVLFTFAVLAISTRHKAKRKRTTGSSPVVTFCYVAYR